jgi:HlyD family secretion protein
MSKHSMSGITRITLIASIACLTLIAAIGIWFYFGKSKTEIKWRTAPIELGPIKVSVTATGTLKAVLTVQVGTQVSGTVSAIYADFNSQVKKGEVIARIDTTLLRASLTDALSNQERNAAQEKQATETLKRTQALFDRDLVSQSELDQSLANARVATANLNSAKAQVERARINLRYATIISPIDGTILSRAVDVGQTVAASFNTPTLFTIAGDLKQMQVQASVDEADIGKIAMGQTATFTVDAYPESVFVGKVMQIRLQPVTVQNVVSYDVVISVMNPDLKLMPGMTASLNIIVGQKEIALLAPAMALSFKPPVTEKASHTAPTAKAGTFNRTDIDDKVFILENGEPKSIKVQAGLTDGSKTEIEATLEPGTMVLIGVEAAGNKNAKKAAPFGMQRSSGSRGGGARFH